jgi:hypothetical protein
VKGFKLKADTTYRIWIQRDPVNEGWVLNVSEDPSGVHELVTTDADGSFIPIELWAIPSYATPTYDTFDIVADKQNDGVNTGKYNAASEGIDSASVAGFVAPVPGLPAFFLFSAGLLMLTGYAVLKRKNG